MGAAGLSFVAVDSDDVAVAADERGPIRSARELLERLEDADKGICTLTSPIQLTRNFGDLEGGATQIRSGVLAFDRCVSGEVAVGGENAGDGGEGGGRFAVRFDRLVFDGEQRDEVQHFIFDGAWFVEKLPEDRQVNRRRVVPPGERIDPLRVGEGPFPVPIGQKADEILRRFDAVLLDGREGDGELLPAVFGRMHQLVLVPKVGAAEADDFRRIVLWYDPEATVIERGEDGVERSSKRLMPRMARTVSIDGGTNDVLLAQYRINTVIDESMFDDSVPEGWRVFVQDFREAERPGGVRGGVRSGDDDGGTRYPGLDVRPEPLPGVDPVDRPEVRRGVGDGNLMVLPGFGGAFGPMPDEDDGTDVAKGGAGGLVDAGVEPFPAPNLSQAVLRRLEAPFLTPAEGRALRLRHGVWREGDLATPEDVAIAAETLGLWDDPTLTLEGRPVLLRAHAKLMRGDADGALELLNGLAADEGGVADRLSAARIRAFALESLGRQSDAAAVAHAGVVEAIRNRTDSATTDEVLDTVRLLALLARSTDPENPDAAFARGVDPTNFESLMAMLATARNADPLNADIRVAEAELLLEKDNPAQAQEALLEALGLNPRHGRAWRLLGDMTVRSFAFSDTQRIAARLSAAAGALGGMSADAEILIARAALRQREPERADRFALSVLDRFPLHREGLALAAAAAAADFRDDVAAERLAVLEQIAPGYAGGYLEVGSALSELRQYEDAAGYLNEAARRRSGWARPWIELGMLELQAGNDFEARDALVKATALDPFNVRAANGLRLVRELITYERIETDHFVIRYRRGVDDVLAREMPLILERIHEVVAGDGPAGIDHTPSRKTTLELYPNHQWFAVRITGMPQIHTIAAATGPVIAMEAPRDGPGHTGVYDWVRTVQHEYTHTVTLSRTRNRIPHWFTEAAAVHLELSPRDDRTTRLLSDALAAGGLFDLDEINIAFVRPRRASDRALAYAQGHWMYEFIVERFGERAPLELMDLYALGQREEAAFQTVLGVGRERFVELFTEWAKEQTVAWGMRLREDQPPLRRLLVDELLADPLRRGPVQDRLNELAADVALLYAGGVGLSERRVGGGERGGRDGRGGMLAPSNVGGRDRDDGGDGMVVGRPFALALPSLTDERITRWVARYPDHPVVLGLAVDRAVTVAGGSATMGMVDLLERYAAARPVDPKPHRLLARLFLATPGEEHRAIPHLSYLDVREQRSASYAVELARRYAALERWEDAAAAADRVTQLAPYNAEHRELAATIMIKASRFDDAHRHLRALADLEPDREIHRRRLQALERLREGAGAR